MTGTDEVSDVYCELVLGGIGKEKNLQTVAGEFVLGNAFYGHTAFQTSRKRRLTVEAETYTNR
jgi:hypothetical protein